MKNIHKVIFGTVVIGVLLLSIDAMENRTMCFNYTWRGPAFNNLSVVNETLCQEVTGGNLHVPCRDPLVISDDGRHPDTDFLWKYYKDSVTCLLVQGEVCVSYEYRFNGAVENITYMCTKITSANEEVITKGCMIDKRGHNRELELCVCRDSLPGGKPCNRNAANPILRTSRILLLFSLILYSIVR